MLEEQFNSDELVQKIEGQVTAELFDAKTGKLIQREETHNFVSQSAIAFLKQAQRTVFKQGIYALNTALMQDYQILDKSNAAIVLTDYSAAEDAANETHMYGQPIGWASRTTYSGTDTLRGTPNAGLSQATTTYCKWVFDWPTTAANGTINSIGWSRFYTGGTLGQYNTLDTSLTGNAFSYASNSTVTQVYNSSTSYSFLSRASSSVCYAGNLGNTTVTKLDASFVVSSTFSVATQFPNGVYGIAWDGGNSKLWVLGLNAGVYKVASYNSSGTLVDAPVTVTSAGRTLRALAYDGQYLWMSDIAGPSCILWRINPATGSDVSSFTFPQPKFVYNTWSESIADLACDTANQIIWVKMFHWESGTTRGCPPSNQLKAFSYTGQPQALSVTLYSWLGTQPSYAYSNSTALSGMVYPTAGTGTYDSFSPSTPLVDPATSSSYSYGFDIIDKYNFICCLAVTNSNTFRVTAINADGMGSRALLGTPIAKTNTQTLRITYQMNYS